jgi:tRNA(Ile2) C34 agmatinyltransferase TiaS
LQYIIGIDDTDIAESRGTGHLARLVATKLSTDFHILGVTRHQLLEDDRVPKTAKNSCAGIIFEGKEYPIEDIAIFARKVLLDNYQPGSDPGLCVISKVPQEIVTFGKQVQQEFIKQKLPRQLSAEHQIYLVGLGGDEDGVIGALAAVGLVAHGSDGRYVMIGSIRDLQGLQTVETVRNAGVLSVQTLDGDPVNEGLILADKLRPARRNHQPVLFVERTDDYWLPLKLD